MTTTFPPSLQPFAEPVSSRYSSDDAHGGGCGLKAGQKRFASGLGAVLKLGNVLAFGVGDVEDVGDAEPAELHRGNPLGCAALRGFLGGQLAHAGCKDCDALCTLLDVAAKRLPRMETGNPLGLGPLKENEQLVIEGVVMKPGYGTQAKS